MPPEFLRSPPATPLAVPGGRARARTVRFLVRPRVIWGDEVAFTCAFDQGPALGGLQPVVAAEPVEHLEHGDMTDQHVLETVATCGASSNLSGPNRNFLCSGPRRSVGRCLGNGGVDLGSREENYCPSRGPASSAHRLSGCCG